MSDELQPLDVPEDEGSGLESPEQDDTADEE
jgi:hypothetical protein